MGDPTVDLTPEERAALACAVEALNRIAMALQDDSPLRQRARESRNHVAKILGELVPDWVAPPAVRRQQTLEALADSAPIAEEIKKGGN